MTGNTVFFWAFAIGVIAGLRSLTAPAAVAWAAHRQWLTLSGTPLAFMGSLPAVIVFIVLAIVELIADKLPSAPARTAPVGLGARIITGALSGACVAEGTGIGHSLLAGAVLGVVGALVGTFVGYQVRTRTVKALGVKDYFVAVTEDIVAIGAAFLILFRS
jgi:uncharacterized membrane protein